MENKTKTKNYYRQNKLKINNQKKKKPIKKILKIYDFLTPEITSLIFFDLEMNCSFHKEENHGVGETISIGAVKYNINNGETTEFYSLIRPTFNNVMSSKIIELTKLLQEDVNDAMSFKEVFLLLEKWVKDDKCIFISWGSDDIRVILGDNHRNGYDLEIVETIKSNFVDFQSEYGLYKSSNQSISLKNALANYNIEFTGNQHNALDDSYNLFRVYLKYKEDINSNESIKNNNVKQLGS